MAIGDAIVPVVEKPVVQWKSSESPVKRAVVSLTVLSFCSPALYAALRCTFPFALSCLVPYTHPPSPSRPTGPSELVNGLSIFAALQVRCPAEHFQPFPIRFGMCNCLGQPSCSSNIEACNSNSNTHYCPAFVFCVMPALPVALIWLFSCQCKTFLAKDKTQALNPNSDSIVMGYMKRIFRQLSSASTWIFTTDAWFDLRKEINYTDLFWSSGFSKSLSQFPSLM